MGSNKRYADQIDARSADRIGVTGPAPATLPPDAFGPRPIEWSGAQTSVWLWVQWHDRVAERRKGYVKGSNDRVCVAWVDGPGGGWEIVVWRQGVTH
ncbi:hypothetical protein [Microbacterium sp. P04]|uniref:hypothetical protein n=1 Tax=Microbacterium sp. P04 TaxID=3366947 RepID=UPI003744C529